MRALAQLAARLYGERLFHLIVVLAALALGAYTISVLGVRNLFNPNVWWQSIAVWFAVAVIGHDLVLFPIYALADRLLPRTRSTPKDPDQRPSGRIPLTNYLRMPTLAAGLLLVMFLPGIIEQGAPTYQAATGLTQAPYLSRWLLLTAIFYLASALCYAVRTKPRPISPGKRHIKTQRRIGPLPSDQPGNQRHRNAARLLTEVSHQRLFEHATRLRHRAGTAIHRRWTAATVRSPAPPQPSAGAQV